jgi:hypothetical protein
MVEFAKPGMKFAIAVGLKLHSVSQMFGTSSEPLKVLTRLML